MPIKILAQLLDRLSLCWYEETPEPFHLDIVTTLQDLKIIHSDIFLRIRRARQPVPIWEYIRGIEHVELHILPGG